MITIDEFRRLEMRVGLVVEARGVEGSTKLIRLVVDLGKDGSDPTSPTASLGAGKLVVIFTAVRPFGYTPEYFLNKKFVFVTNLEPKKIMGEESQGMILAVGDERPVFLSAMEDVDVGAKVR